MTMTELRKLYRADPFRPFVLHMLEGATIEVPGREWMLIGPGAKSLFVVADRGGFHWVRDVRGIVSLKFKRKGHPHKRGVRRQGRAMS